MAITLTTRLSAGFAGGAAATATSGSFTPSANSKLYVAVMIVASGGDGSLFDIVHTSNTGGLTFSRVAQTTHSGGGNGGKMALFEASVGGSPSSMTVTFDVDSDGAETSYTWIGAFDATGNSVQIKSGQTATAATLGSGGSAESHTSGTLPASATTGNTAIVVLGRNNDDAGAAAVPSGWTALFNPTDIYVSGVCFYRTDFTGTSVTITDAGETVHAMGSVILELEEASGGGSVTAVAATSTAQAHAPSVSGANVEYVSQGAAVAGTTSITTAAYGTDWAAGDLGVCVVASNHSTTESTEPTVDGFTKIGTLNGGGGSQGAGTGNRRLTFFTRELQAGDDTTPAISLSTGNVMIAAITILKKRAGYTWDTAVSAFGAETTAGTSWSEAMTTDPGFSAEDMLIAACAVRDTSDSSAEGFSATGATFGTLTERIDLSSETGNDIALHVATAPVLTGPSSAAGTRTATHSTSESGVMGVLRVRATNSGAANVNAVTATATAAAPAPAVSASSAVAPPAATAVAVAVVPVVAGETVVSGGSPAAATMQAIAPAVSATQNPTVAAVAATSTATAPAPAVSASSTVTAVAATATAAAPAPVVTGGTGSSDGTVVAVTATATATAVAPAVEAEGAVSGGGPATATMQAHAPTVTGIRNATVAAATLLATAAALAPVVSGSGSVNVSSVVATASATAVAPAVSAGSTVTASTAAGTAAAIAPAVSGSVVVTVPTATATAAAHAPNVDPGVGITDPGPRVAHTPREYRVAHVARDPRYVGGD